MNLLPKFKEFLFSQSKPSSKVTVKNYSSDISRFIRWFEGKFAKFSPDLVTPQIIEQFRQSSNLTASSLERNLSSLRKFFNFLVLEGVISQSPLKIENLKLKIEDDPYHLKAFRDYLYVYNASKLTIKNYLMDVKGFTKWAEEVINSKNAWDTKEKDILEKIDSPLIEEYKRRLPYAPRTINRKLSSLRKYLKWAKEEGLIENVSSIKYQVLRKSHVSKLENAPTTKYKIQATSYSRFPPFRLAQKIVSGIAFIPEFILINPLASLAQTIELLIWKLKGKPIFEKQIVNRKLKIVNLPKASFAPFAISTRYLPFHKKLIFHLAHTRPKWYKRYHEYSFSHYLHLAILMVFMSVIGFGIYQNIYPKSQNQGVLGFANPQIPPRILSFQGRLTDSSDNPITSSTNLRFALYDSPTSTGSALLWQEINTVTPDSDGIFSLLLGNRSTMSQSLFAERAGLWLGVTVGQTAELTPRQRLATVAYAENADNLQGLPPITQSGAGTTNVVLALNSSGNLSIGGSATPTFESTGGKMTLSGKVLSLVTVAGTNSNIEIKPDGLGKIDLQKPLQNSTNNNNVTTALGAVEFDDLVAILATSSGQSAFTVNQNGAGPILSASSSGTAKFTVSNAGGVTLADDLAINGGDVTSTQTTFNLLNSTVTTLNIGGAATTINLGATSGTTTTANSLTILGNTTLGDTAADTISFTGSINSNVVPDANNTRNLGSSSLRWNTVYGTTGDFTSIAGTVTGGSTTSSSWTINSDNATANAEVASLAFETGTAAFNDVLQWNASGDAGRVTGFDNTNLFNFPIGIYSQVSGANQTFTSGTLFKYGQPAVHAITQSAAFLGSDIDFSSNITVPNSSSGNQTGYKTTLKDGGTSATAIGFQTAGALDYGIDLGGTIGTAEIRLSNAETIDNLTNGKVKVTATNLDLSGTAYQINGSSGSTVSACGASQYLGGVAVTGGIVTTLGTCQTVSTAWNSLTDPTGALALSMGANTTTFTWNAATGASTNLFNLADTASNTGTGYLLNVGTATSSNLKPLQIQARGTTIIDTTAAGAVTVNAATSATTPLTAKGATSQSADLLQIKSSIDAILAKIDSLGNISGRTLESTVSTGTAPLIVASTTVVSNLNASLHEGYSASALYSQPQPNLILNSDFGRRNKWMTFMPEVFTDASGWTLLGGSGAPPAPTGNLWKPSASTNGTIGGASIWGASAGIAIWRDARMSASIKWCSTGGGCGHTRLAFYVNDNNWVFVITDGGTFRMTKRVGGTDTQLQSDAITALTASNFYWLELEKQGTTFIGKFYSCPVAATACSKSSATLVDTIVQTISASGLSDVGGQIAIMTDTTGGTQIQWGGLSTGDGGVYVEGWGPESVDVSFTGTKGGQAIGFNEATDSGPIGKQWAFRIFNPALASRGFTINMDTPDGSAAPSTNYVGSLYTKYVSGTGGGGSDVALRITPQLTDSSLGILVGSTLDIQQNDAAGWNRKTGSAISNASARRARVNMTVPAGGTATNVTAEVMLPQFEQGSVATPWRNAPADDGPITWNLRYNWNVNLTSAARSATEIDSRDLAGNLFFPWDGTAVAEAQLTDKSDTINAVVQHDTYFDGVAMETVSPGGASLAYYEQQVANKLSMVNWRRSKAVTAGKHRIAALALSDVGTNSYFVASNVASITVTLARGKFDLAEEYSIEDQSIEAGDVVKVKYGSTVEKTNKAYDSSTFGIISTDPGITLSSTVELNGYREKPNLRPVALQGRVPVKVTNENGVIRRGDILTSSNTLPGYAMKATKAGKSIGIAMEDFYGTEGKIMTFVNLSWYDPDVYLTDTGELKIVKVQQQMQVVSATPNPETGLYPSDPTESGSASLVQNTNCVQTVDSSNFGLVSTVCPENPIQNFTYEVRDSFGTAIERVSAFSQVVAGTLKAGVIQTGELIADNITVNNKIISPIAEIQTVRTDTISPLSTNKVVIKLDASASSASESGKPSFEIQNASGSAVAIVDDQGNATFSGTLNSFGLISESASISGTLRTKNLIADNIESQVSSIKYLVSGITDKVASLSGSLNTIYDIPNTESVNIASYSAMLANVDTLNANVGNFTGGLFAVGPTTLSDATVFGQLAVGGNLILADNSINVLGSDLQIQPLGQGGISFLSGKVVIDANGNLSIEGNATVKGTLFANVLSPIPDKDLVVRLGSRSPYGNTASDSAKFIVQNASGSAVLTVDNQGDLTSSGSAKFNDLLAKTFSIVRSAQADTSLNETIASSSAGFAVITAGEVERTIITPFVKEASLIYITPTSDTQGKTPYVARQTIEDLTLGTKASFTIGISQPVDFDIKLNWWIIN